MKSLKFMTYFVFITDSMMRLSKKISIGLESDEMKKFDVQGDD
jgi:hypothetical protein